MKSIIKFDTLPSNIEVYIDGENAGVTPLDITDVDSGVHSYTLKRNENDQFNGKLYSYPGKITQIYYDFNDHSKNEKYENILSLQQIHPNPSINVETPESTEYNAINSAKLERSAQQEYPTRQKRPSGTIDIARKTKDKSIFYNTGHVIIKKASTSPPDSTDNYPSVQDVYANNNQNPIEVMTLMNHGPGNLFYILRDKSQTFSATEEILHVGESRILFNVYEIRARTDIPNTEYHLVEGELRAASFSRNYKNFVENRIVLQQNEANLSIQILFDTDINPIVTTLPVAPINVPNPGPFPTFNAANIREAPLGPGLTAGFIAANILSDNIAITNEISAAQPAAFPFMLPFIIPKGYIAEGFLFTINTSTNCTVRSYLDLVPGTFTLSQTVPLSARGNGLNLALNINFISTQVIDPTGAPTGGRRFMVTITNDDTVNNMIGTADFELIIRKLS